MMNVFFNLFQWDGKSVEDAYTQTELDEVRCEWADIVSDYM